jgi:hypothetical protein
MLFLLGNLGRLPRLSFWIIDFMDGMPLASVIGLVVKHASASGVVCNRLSCISATSN